MDTTRPSPRTNRTRRVPHPVLIGYAASLSQVRESWKPHFVRIGADRQLSFFVNRSDLTPIRASALEECTVSQDPAVGKACLEIALMKRGWISNGQETIRLRFSSPAPPPPLPY